MTKVEGYKCDYCKTLYAEEDAARKCESSHVVIVSTEAIHRKTHAFPREVIIEFSNGDSAYYAYEAHVSK